MFARINIWKIVSDHFKTLRHITGYDSKFVYWKDLMLFCIFPFALSAVLTFLGYTFTECLGDLITAISILGGFLFNLLAIIYSQIDKIKDELSRDNSRSELQILKKKFVNEIHANISFCIVLSIILILTLLLTKVDIPSFLDTCIFRKVIVFVNYFLLLMFLLTLLMIINRIYILLKKDVD